jgi:mannosyl-oligosaccharide glucosidase
VRRQRNAQRRQQYAQHMNKNLDKQLRDVEHSEYLQDASAAHRTLPFLDGNMRGSVSGGGRPGGVNVVMVQQFFTLPFSVELTMTTLLPGDDDAVVDVDDDADGDDDSGGVGGGGGVTDVKLAAAAAAFDHRFDSIFPPRADDATVGGKVVGDDVRTFAKATMSNLVGGIGYFHGASLVGASQSEAVTSGNGSGDAKKKEAETTVVETAARSLLTGVPSRSFFPRGFLWDEGFHQLLVQQWDATLATTVIAHWLALITGGDTDDVDGDGDGDGASDGSSISFGGYTGVRNSGWLPREQILGLEARERVPAEFRVQRPHIANPPTLLLALRTLMRRVRAATDGAATSTAATDAATDSFESESTSAPRDVAARLPSKKVFLSFLKGAYAALRRHAAWYARTQASNGDDSFAGDENDGADDVDGDGDGGYGSFRWAGRTKDHCLASGLDDFPRALFVAADGREGHVDMHAWMVTIADTMSEVATWLTDDCDARGDDNESDDNNDDAGDDSDSAGNKCGGDGGYTSTAYRSHSTAYAAKRDAWTRSLDRLHWNEKKQMYCDFIFTVKGKRKWVCHFGYVSLFPLLLQILPPDSPRLGAVLASMRAVKRGGKDDGGIWTQHGLRSLARSDKRFGSGEDYWRGHVWMNINYLAVAALHAYANGGGAFAALAAEVYANLRANLVSNVVGEYRRTGYVWEQYAAVGGEGRRSHPFTGWTALITLILAERYQ